MSDGFHDNPYACIRQRPELPKWFWNLLNKYDLEVAYDSMGDRLVIGTLIGGPSMYLERSDLDEKRRKLVAQKLKDSFDGYQSVTLRGLIS